MKESEVYEILNNLNMFESRDFLEGYCNITYQKVPFGFLVSFFENDGDLKTTFVYDGRDK